MALAGGDLVVGVVGFQVLEHPEMPAFDFRESQSFEDTVVALPQERTRLDVVPRGLRDETGGLNGPSQIAGDQHIEMDGFQPAAHGPCLLPAGLGQGTVSVPLKPFLDVPDRLSMADDHQGSGDSGWFHGCSTPGDGFMGPPRSTLPSPREPETDGGIA